jgi:hypothetical protein
MDLIIIQYQILTNEGVIENNTIAIPATEESLLLIEKLKELAK